MTSMDISQARQSFAAAVDEAQHQPLFIKRSGREVAVLISPEAYERLVAAAEDDADIAAFDAAMNDGAPNLLWADVKADLGL